MKKANKHNDNFYLMKDLIFKKFLKKHKENYTINILNIKDS